MRKSIVMAAVAALALSALPATAGGKGAHQHVEGSIALPAKYTDNSCYPGLHRRLTVASGGGVNGIVGYNFDIDPKTWNKPFTLTPEGGEGYVDLDIVFYTDFGTTEQAADTAYAPPTVGFEDRSADGEAGVVPREMNKAIVCMFADEVNGAGVNATFSYMSGKGVKAPRG